MIFRNWVLQNFPFLEDDFDALTDYELFCKMVEYMKKSLDKVKEYQTQLNEFRTGVICIAFFIWKHIIIS